MIKDFDLFCRENGIGEETKNYINNNIRNAGPARRVRSRVGNVPGFYSSRKMGLTIQFESHKLELCAIYLMEFDKSVHEYYDQPQSFKINYIKNGRNIGYNYTADYFVISDDFIGWEEDKTEEELSKLLEESPERYVLDENGHWRCPPAEEYAKKKGLSFRVRSSKEINWTLQNNIRFLEDYLLEENPSVALPSRNTILNYIRSVPNITLDDLLSIEDAGFTADDVYKLIIFGEIYANLEKYLIIKFDKFPLFINKETADAILNVNESKSEDDHISTDNLVNVEVGKEIIWNGNLWMIINVGETQITLLDEGEKAIPLPITTFEELIKMGVIKSLDNKVSEQDDESGYIEIIRSASPDELAEANEKYYKLRQYMDGESVDVPSRTLRHWKHKYLRAKKEYGKGYIGLLPARHKQGNRTRKISHKVIELIGEFIEGSYKNKKQRKKSSVYNSFVKKCQEMGYDPPSDKTFFGEIKKVSKYEIDKARRGPRAAYDKEPVYWELSLTTPRHGSRPFEIAHIDHTELDIELLCSQTGKKLGRPWLTLLVDAFSRRVLAFHLTYDPPSYRSNMMTLRECVKKYSRLPKTIIVDGGKDFQSTYFDTLLATYECHKKTRPGAKPRYGSVIERLFGTNNTEFIYNLIGNTQLTKNVRQVTKEFNPRNLAIWTLETFYEILYQYLYEIYDKRPHSSLDQSPRDAYQQNIRKTGERKQTYIRYDANFEMLTLPTTTKGTAKVQPSQGIKINNAYYNSYDLNDPLVEGKQIPVRYDPFDYSKAYAYVRNYWVTLRSQHELAFEGRTEKEIRIATAEIKRRKKETQKSKTNSVSAAELASFLESIEAHELLEIQRLKDEAVRKTLRVIDGGKSQHSKRNAAEKVYKDKHTSIDEEGASMKESKKEEFESFEMYGEFF